MVPAGIIEATCQIPANLLNDEFYRIRILVVENASKALFDLHDIISFKMEERERNSDWHGKWIGMVRPHALVNWTF